MTTLVVVQARVGSRRLPGKVLLPVLGAPLLERQIERLLCVRRRFELVIATTTEPADDSIAALCARLALACFRGHPTDLLDRHYQAARAARADVVVKIPADCPLIDPLVVEQVLDEYALHPGAYDYVSNLHPATWPDGNDVEVLSMTALEAAWREAERGFEREHTTPFVWERPERFRLGNVRWPRGLDLSMSRRFTVDYLEDYRFVCAVYEALWRRDRPAFGVDAILALLERRPELRALNAMYVGVNWYRHHLHELRTIGAEATRQEETWA
jgi:spore coat polysaccharide biosynthesis protein SpsF